MNYRHLIALSLSLIIILPCGASEGWSEQTRADFVAQCLKQAGSSRPEQHLRSYCDCSATEVSSSFSEAELLSMSQQPQPDPRLQQRLLAAARVCGKHVAK